VLNQVTVINSMKG